MKGVKTGGRVAGTPNAATREIKEAARKHGAEAIAALVAIMRESENEANRISAIREILDRGYGKASQKIEGDEDNPVRVVTTIRLVGVEPS